eukprot:2842196-Rhodomonas_salina.1
MGFPAILATPRAAPSPSENRPRRTAAFSHRFGSSAPPASGADAEWGSLIWFPKGEDATCSRNIFLRGALLFPGGVPPGMEAAALFSA